MIFFCFVLFCFYSEVQNPSKGSCYLRLRHTVYWDHALEICSKIDGSHIAVANDCEELLEIQNIMQYAGDIKHFWLGCSEDEGSRLIRCLDNSSSYWNISSESGVGFWRK